MGRTSLLPTLFFSLSVGLPAPAQDAGDLPNVVMILVDDLGWTDLGCYGSKYYQTPNIDRLAREGVRFTQAYAACAVCSPTRAAVLTGKNPARLGVTDWIHSGSGVAAEAVLAGEYVPGYDPPAGRPLLTPRNRSFLDHDEVTIAELLEPPGYTSCHIGKWHLGPEGWLPTDQGFAFNIGGYRFGSPPSYFDPYTSEQRQGIPGLESRVRGEYLTDREADEAVAFIETHRDRPFFLYLSHYAVHSPLQAKPELVQKYEGAAKTNQKVPVYAAMVESVDDAVGKVLACLEQNGLSDRTLVVFTSDNGGAVHFPATDNAPLRLGKGYPYEGGLRVPLIVRWPAVISPGRTEEVPVSSIDLLPTIAEAAGLDLADQDLDGVSLMPVLRETGDLRRDTLIWHFPHYWWGTRIEPYSVIRQGDWKLIRHYSDGRRELFDLAHDIGETRDMAAGREDLVERLDTRLSDELARMDALFPKINPDYRR